MAYKDRQWFYPLSKCVLFRLFSLFGEIPEYNYNIEIDEIARMRICLVMCGGLWITVDFLEFNIIPVSLSYIKLYDWSNFYFRLFLFCFENNFTVYIYCTVSWLVTPWILRRLSVHSEHYLRFFVMTLSLKLLFFFFFIVVRFIPVNMHSSSRCPDLPKCLNTTYTLMLRFTPIVFNFLS